MTAAPVIIQGGMGVGISDWRLARAVSSEGQLGVVSGTALDQVLPRRLQMGDPGGHMRRALDHFPVPHLAEQVWDTYYVHGGKDTTAAFTLPPMATTTPSHEWLTLCVVANFVEVFLAREGHTHPVGINYLEKIQIPHLPSIYGAMLAGVSYVLMGAGIPLKIPGVLDRYVRHEPATYPLNVTGGAADAHMLSFDPQAVIGLGPDAAPLARPTFLAIIASDVLALTLQRRANGRVDGFIVESPTAGGHNAPPRGTMQLNADGEPVYGPRDTVNLEKLRALGLPFWLAGGAAAPGRLQDALEAGASGIQVGTAFALCEESGLRPDYRQTLLDQARTGHVHVHTSPVASPAGFPFKVADLPDTLSNPAVMAARPRICDLGYLREAFQMEDGAVGFRCPAEPVSLYASKGGDPAATEGRACICNGLIATAGLPQVRAGRHTEPAIVTMGDDVGGAIRFLPDGATRYRARDVVHTLLAEQSLLVAE
jgi:nitronate monooxygenase